MVGRRLWQTLISSDGTGPPRAGSNRLNRVEPRKALGLPDLGLRGAPKLLLNCGFVLLQVCEVQFVKCKVQPERISEVRSNTAVITHCGKTAHWLAALDLLSGFAHLDLEPNVITFSSMAPWFGLGFSLYSAEVGRAGVSSFKCDRVILS